MDRTNRTTLSLNQTTQCALQVGAFILVVLIKKECWSKFAWKSTVWLAGFGRST